MTKLILGELGTPAESALESYSPFVIKVRRALHGAGLRFESERRPAPAAWSDLNPAGQVPVLRVGKEVVIDSTAILQRIAKLAPGAFEASDADAQLWEEFADADLNGFVVGARWCDDESWQRTRPAFFGPAPDEVVGPMRANVVAAVHGRNRFRLGQQVFRDRFEERLDQLDARAPARGYWSGAFSVADLALFAQLHSLCDPITPFYEGAIAARPRLVDYLARVDRRTQNAGLGRERHRAVPA